MDEVTRAMLGDCENPVVPMNRWRVPIDFACRTEDYLRNILSIIGSGDAEKLMWLLNDERKWCVQSILDGADIIRRLRNERNGLFLDLRFKEKEIEILKKKLEGYENG